MKILIAEDDPGAARSLRETLERLGHEVAVAADGEEAWGALEAEPPSLLISEWSLPRLDGPALCRRVRGRESDAYTYIILLTPDGLRGRRLNAFRDGADDFLPKPTDGEELALRLAVALRSLGVREALARQDARAAVLASVDELTGAKNRRRFREDLELYFAQWSRQGSPLSVVMLDVDHFKQYNDSFGHPAGDETLRAVANLLGEGTRAHDVVARYGGEEFAILLPTADADEALAVAERLRERIERHPWPSRGVTVSLGVATAGADIPTPGALVEAADRALYHSKRAGRNRVTHERAVGDGTAP